MNSGTVIMHVTYKVKPGMRDEFAALLRENRISEKSEAEEGSICYQYYFPWNSPDDIFILEMWANDACQKKHIQTEHFKMLGPWKEKYVIETVIDRYDMP